MNIHLSAISKTSTPCEHCGRSDEQVIRHFNCLQTPTKVTRSILEHSEFEKRQATYVAWVKDTCGNGSRFQTHIKELKNFVVQHGDKDKWDLHWYEL